jgi:hypothetical protein
LNTTSRVAVVMGASTRFAWCALDDEVIMLSAQDAVRFPNAILARGGWDRLEPGEEILIGSGAVLGRSIDWHIARWWDPGVTQIDAEPTEVIARVSCVARSLPAAPQLTLEAALASGDHAAIVGAGSDMLGAGRGLTPEGDDRLAGSFVAYRHVTASLGHPELGAMIDDVGGELLDAASKKTTRLSVTLLRHALAGEVPDPVADLIRALTGWGSLPAALERCLALGGSSGRALARGIVSGARAGCEVAA